MLLFVFVRDGESSCGRHNGVYCCCEFSECFELRIEACECFRYFVPAVVLLVVLFASVSASVPNCWLSVRMLWLSVESVVFVELLSAVIVSLSVIMVVLMVLVWSVMFVWLLSSVAIVLSVVVRFASAESTAKLLVDVLVWSVPRYPSMALALTSTVPSVIAVTDS